MSDCCCNSGCCCTGGEPRPSASAAGSVSVPVISTSLSVKDILGTWKVRWGIGRDSYTVKPGLYAVGKPDTASPVLVSANYKLSFDILRKNLTALDCWLLILDTKGINVWCAAGKGTFGTDELVSRIDVTGLTDIVEHRQVIIPQLGATGVSAHETVKRTGFTVVFGPVRANDIKEFIAADYKATKEMRTVKFTFWDRLILTPMELAEAVKTSMVVFGVLFLLNLFARRPFGLMDFIAYSAAVLAGTVLTPVLLPFIPGRAFSFKGWLLGAISTAFAAYTFGWFTPPFLLLGIGYMLVLPALSAFLAMNFTGATTYTSFSGVIKEMKIAVPAIILFTAAGVVLVLIKTFI
ncbi:MAG: mercury methylation corrinoid protein HgcA [Treponema sp.]|nr:mercury methylation corrinoid protein HgcA [Treponema sp.]